MLDLSAQVMTRARSIEVIPFWTTEGFQRIRGARYVYRPLEAGGRGDQAQDEDSSDWEQLEFEVNRVEADPAEAS